MTKFAGRFFSILGCVVLLLFGFLYIKNSVSDVGEKDKELSWGGEVEPRRSERLEVQGPLRDGGNQAASRRGPDNNSINKSDGDGRRETQTDGRNSRDDGTDAGMGMRLAGPREINNYELQGGALRLPPSPIKGDRNSAGTDNRNLTCDQECNRFKDLLKTWPSAKPKAAIYLLTHSSRLTYLKRILSQIDQYFNKKYNYPIIIFHEKELLESIPSIKGYTSSDIYFQEVYFTLPSFLKEPVVFNIPCTSHISYRHMCRFHAKGIYEEPIMQDLHFVWRLDDDSELLRAIKYDVFEFMFKRNYMYGYVIKHWDALVCTTGLWNASVEFINTRNISPTFFDSWKEPQLYYNNFEISNLKLWMSEGYKDYIDFLDRLGGIFYHRWGDAPMKGIAVSIYVNKNQTYFFQDIAYRHRSMQNVRTDDIPSAV